MALARGAVRTKVEVTGTRESKRKLDSMDDSLRGLASRGVGDLRSSMAAAAPQIAALTAVVGGVTVAIQAATRIAKEAAKAYAELGRRGGAFSAVARQFESMASPDLLSRLQELSGWHLTQLELMRSFNRVISVGAVTQEQFEEIVTRTTARAQAMGANVSESFGRLANAMAGRDMQQALSELGLSLDEIRDSVLEAGASMESEEGSAIAWNLALQQLRDTQGEVDNSAANLADAFEALESQTDDFIDTTARWVSESPAAIEAFTTLRQEIFGTDGAAKEAGIAVAQFAQQAIATGAMVVSQTATLIRRVVDYQLEMFRTINSNPTIRTIIEAVYGEGLIGNFIQNYEQLSATLSSLVSSANEVAGRTMAADLLAGPQDRNQPRRPRRARPGQEDGGGAAEDARESQALFEDIIGLQDAILEGIEEQRAQERALLEAQMAGGQERKEFENQIREEQAEAIEDQIELENMLKDAQRDRIESMISATRDMAGAVHQSFKAIIAIMEASGASTEKTKKAYGIFMVAYNSVLAATDLADAIRSFASQDYGAGVGYLAAMAAHIAAAVQAGAELGGGNAKQPTGTFTPSQRAEPADNKVDGEATVINNNYGFGQTNSAIGEAVTEHVDRYRRMDGGDRYRAPAFSG